ncbi:MAG: flagellar basal body P-ring formation chaperone FlgA [Pirellulaceae bacterium]
MLRYIESAWSCLLFAIMVTLSPSFAVAQSSTRVEVSLSESSMAVATDNFSIGDVASISGGNPLTRVNIAKLDLGSLDGLPSLTIDRNSLYYRIRLAGISDEQFFLSGPDTASIVRFQPDDVFKRLEQKLHAELCRRFPISESDLVVEIPVESRRQLEAKLKNFVGDFELDLDATPSLPLGNAYLRWKMRAADTTATSFSSIVHVARMQRVLVTKQPVQRGDLISAEMVEESVIRVDRSGVFPASAEELIGKRAARNINAFTTIEAQAVSNSLPQQNSQPTVRANSILELILVRGSLKIRHKGVKTLQAGNPGDWIEAENIQTKARIRCKILDGSTAIIE